MGNNGPCDVTGIGSIRLKVWDVTIKILEEVRYIPDLKRNLVSLEKLDKKWMFIEMSRWSLESNEKFFNNLEGNSTERPIHRARVNGKGTNRQLQIWLWIILNYGIEG